MSKTILQWKDGTMSSHSNVDTSFRRMIISSSGTWKMLVSRCYIATDVCIVVATGC